MKGDILIPEFLATPWAMERVRLAAMARVVAGWMARGQVLEAHAQRPRAMEDEGPASPPISAFEAARRQANDRVGAGAIAVIPVYGPISQRMSLMGEICGGCSTEQISGALRETMADETVGAVLLNIDSPGGSVYGVAELADEIHAARAKKPVIGIANSLAASAAYWIGCACTELYVTPGGEVGSIGVWMAHEDWSRAMEEAGVKTTLISAGQYKTEGNPYEPLGEDARGFMQSRVDDYYRSFTQGVARGRGVPIASVRDGMGQGRVLGADQALTEKMVDGVSTFDQVVKKIRGDLKTPARNASRLAQAQRDVAIAEAE